MGSAIHSPDEHALATFNVAGGGLAGWAAIVVWSNSLKSEHPVKPESSTSRVARAQGVGHRGEWIMSVTGGICATSRTGFMVTVPAVIASRNRPKGPAELDAGQPRWLSIIGPERRSVSVTYPTKVTPPPPSSVPGSPRLPHQ